MHLYTGTMRLLLSSKDVLHGVRRAIGYEQATGHDLPDEQQEQPREARTISPMRFINALR